MSQTRMSCSANKGVLQMLKINQELSKKLAILVVTYNFNAVNWNLEEIKRIERKIQKPDVIKMYIPRKKGKQKLTSSKMVYKQKQLS